MQGDSVAIAHQGGVALVQPEPRSVTSLGARFWISMLGFCEPSRRRFPGEALENPTGFVVDEALGAKLVGDSITGEL